MKKVGIGLTQVHKFQALRCLTIFAFGLCLVFADKCFAQNSNRSLRTTGSLFRATTSAQVVFEDPTILEQALQDKIETELDNNDQYDQDFKWAAMMHERGLLDAEQISGIAKNRVANRARKSFEALIDGSDVERGYRKMEKGIKKVKDYSTVEFGKKADGKLFAQKINKNKPTVPPFAVFYLQPNLSSGLSAVMATSSNVKLEFQPTQERVVIGYSINF